MGKRKIVISSDSEDEQPPSVSPVKSARKRIRSSNSGAARQSSKKEVFDESFELSDDDELVRGTNKKKSKRSLPPGQRTLNFTVVGKITGKSSEKLKNEVASPVNPKDFFQLSAPKHRKEKITDPRIQIPEKSPVKKNSPSQKENTSVKKSKPDDEFVDSDDSFDSFTPISKMKEITSEKRGSSKTSKLNIISKEKLPKLNEIQSSSSKPSNSQLKTSKDEVTDNFKVVTHNPVNRIEKKKEEYSLSWVDKYKPTNSSQLVGQHGDKSPMNKLIDWLRNWAKLNLGEGAKVKRAKPAPWMAQQDGTAFKAALLSGSPGVGKTSCAYMVCESMGYKYIEMNASDVRNKKHLEAKIGELSGSHQIDQFLGKKFVAQDNMKVHHVLIMDEVDGMSGNEDRAGVSELIQIIKETKIPIICICNDRQHPKIRSLANYCYDLRFQKPRVEQIRARMMTICALEKFKIGKDELDQIIELSGHDVRQTIYNLQMRSKASNVNINKKDVALGPFEAAKKLLDSRSTLMEKQEMFFVDYGIMPLFVQENYLNMRNDKHKPIEAIKGIRKAANFISLGDIVDREIRGGGAWKLLNEQSMLSAALPAMATDGHLRAMIQFPSWLGKNSTSGKRRRLLQQLVLHTHLKVSANTTSFAIEYAPILRARITKPLIDRETDGIQDVIETMTEYDLIKDDSEALSELVVWPGKIDPASKILSKVKASLTRTLNKTPRMLPYSIDEVSKTKKRGVNSVGIEMDDEGNLVEAFEDGDEDDEANDNAVQSSEVVVKVTQSSKGTTTGQKTRGAKSGRGRRGR